MKKTAYTILTCLILFCSCEKEEITALAFNYIPETDIAELQLGMEAYSYEELLQTTSGKSYKLAAIYDCYPKGGKMYYVLNPYHEDTTNQLYGMTGDITCFQIHDGYIVSVYEGFPNHDMKNDFRYDESSQSFYGYFGWAHFEGVPNRLVYLNEDFLVIQWDAPWNRNQSAEKGAVFSREVYKRVR